MQITLLAIGKTQSSWIAEGTRIYVDRMRHYGKFEFIETPDTKLKQSKKDPEAVKEAEATILEKFIGGVDHLILLDEKGKAMGSLAFSKHLQNLQNRGIDIAGKPFCIHLGGLLGFVEFDQPFDRTGLDDVSGFESTNFDSLAIDECSIGAAQIFK